VIEKLFPVAGVFVSSVRDYGGRETNFGVRNPDTKDYNTFDRITDRTNSMFRVKKIEEFQEEEVWCLEVEGDRSFVLASGLSTGNCSFCPVDHWKVFSEIMFLLLGGTGCGYSVQRHHVDKLPEIKARLGRNRRYLIGDSIEGWADAVKMLVSSYFHGTSKIVFDFSDIRPKGERLVTSGGKAPGPQPLKDCIHNLDKILSHKEPGDKLTPLECHDMICYIADAVLAGGIRRAALISLFSFDDDDMIGCKYGNWWEANPQRGRANNSAVILRHKIDKSTFMSFWKKVEASRTGEPGIFLTNDKEVGTNPCAEIALKANSFCNLTTINASDVEDQAELNKRVRAAAFIGTLQASYTDFHYLRDCWRRTTEKDSLLGVSMTGIASNKVFDCDLKEASQVVLEENERLSKLLGINKAARTTCVKPEGSSSLVVGTSSGIHAWYAPYYIRRIRVGKNEAIYQYLKRKMPSLVEDDFFKKQDAVISIPVKSPDGAIYSSEKALNILERVKRVSMEWVHPGHRRGDNKHNVSATIATGDDEWDEVGKWMWENRKYYAGLTVLPRDGGTYKQMPFEEIDKEEYDRLFKELAQIDLSEVGELEDNTDLQGEIACGGGSCEIK
jgi:ribonucleoside-diphosphate reductase alpha chain